MNIIGGFYDSYGWNMDPTKRITTELLALWIEQYKISDDPWVLFSQKVLAIKLPPNFFLVMPWYFDEKTRSFWVQGGTVSPHIIFVSDEGDWENAQIVYNLKHWNPDRITEESLRAKIEKISQEKQARARASMAIAQKDIARANEVLEAFKK